MQAKTSLKITLAVSVAGILFSGYLSYNELFAGYCPLGGCPSVAKIPACVYGFVMYSVVFIVSLLGLKSGK